jgi:hypothetical protein
MNDVGERSTALDDVAARVYGVPPEDFVAARAEAVAQARKDGDRALATAVGKLRKPTVAAWLVNLLAHQRPQLIADLLDLGAQLRQAQRELHGADIRQLSLRRRRLVGELARESRELAVAAGRGARDPLPIAEVESTLTAALADESVAELVQAGRVTRSIEYGGFGEPPRPQLHLVRGRESPRRVIEPDAGPAEPAEATTKVDQDPTDRADLRRADSDRAKADGAGADRTSADRAKPDRARADRTEPDGAAADQTESDQAESDRAESDRAAAERVETAERAAAERIEAAHRRATRAAAHRELLAARTALAEAEAARTTAERMVLAARRRVEAALSGVADIESDSPAT